MDLDSLPPRQKDVVRLIVQLTEEHGYPPTLAELAQAMGLKNRMTIHQHVVALKKKGIVRWEPGLNRSLRLVETTQMHSLNSVQEGVSYGSSKANITSKANIKGIPLAGSIAAGNPIDAINTNDYLAIDAPYAEEGCFALKVKGESMIEEGICDGDYVIVKPKPSPSNGEIVVALLEDGSATLKRFFKEKNRFRLQPSNSSMEPIYIDSMNDLQIQGVVVALFRKF